MGLFHIVKYIEGNYFEDLTVLHKRLTEVDSLPYSGRIFMNRDLAIEYAKTFAIENRCKCLVFELKMEDSTLIVPTVRADEVKLE